MLRQIAVTQDLYDRLLELRGPKKRGSRGGKTMSDVIEEYIPEFEEDEEDEEDEDDCDE